MCRFSFGAEGAYSGNKTSILSPVAGGQGARRIIHLAEYVTSRSVIGPVTHVGLLAVMDFFAGVSCLYLLGIL